jgi:hypothetical protein
LPFSSFEKSAGKICINFLQESSTVLLLLLLVVVVIVVTLWGGGGEEEKCRNAYRILVENPERKSSPGKVRCKCEDNITTDIIYIKLEGLECIYLVLNAKNCRVIVNTEMKLRIP